MSRSAKRKRRKQQQQWMAMSMLVASTVVPSIASAASVHRGFTTTDAMLDAIRSRQSAAFQDPVAAQRGDLPVQVFAIPEATLEQALADFERLTGLHVTVPDASVLAITSPGVHGAFTATQALEHLLEGTSLAYRVVAADTLALEFRATEAVHVTGAPPQTPPIASPKYTEPLLSTPQSIDVVTEDVMDEQATTTLRDALRNVAGISLAAGEGGSQGDNLTIRGFSARSDLFIDGMRDFGSYYRDPFNTENVQVLQGPSSVTFGRGSTGGVVNQASKAPERRRFVDGDVTLGTDATRRITLDLNQPIAALGDGASFRLNVMGHDADVAGRDVAQNRRVGVAPSLAFGLGSPTRWTFSYLHQEANDVPDYGIPWYFNAPAPVPHNNYYGFADGSNYLRTRDDIATAKVEHDVDANITIRNQARYARYIRDVRITEPQIPAGTLSTTPLSSIQIVRNELAADSTEGYLDDQLDITIRMRAGAIEHAMVTGVEVGRETSNPTRPKYTNVPTTSLLTPDPTQPFAGAETIGSSVNTTSDTEAAYVVDTAKLGARWELTGGVRVERFATAYTQSVPPASAFSRVDLMPTWRAAAVFKPTERGSLYAAAGTSFNPSAESLSLSAANANLPPEQNVTYEVGAKWDLAGGRLSTRAAIFQTDKLNAREPDPTNSLLNVLAGNQRVDGVQVAATGAITSRWSLMSSYAFLDSRVVSSQYYPLSVGQPLANVPRHTFNLWTTYQVGRAWQVGGGSDYVSSRTASSTAPFDPTTGLLKQVPGYWLFNGMVKRTLTPRVDVQANINNLTNAYYYDLLHPAHIILGPSRNLLVGLRFKL